MYKHNQKSKTGKPGQPSISEYFRLKAFYDSFPGRIINGVMTVYYFGEWISKEEFDKLVTVPKMPDFKANLLNIDRTRLWQWE